MDGRPALTYFSRLLALTHHTQNDRSLRYFFDFVQDVMPKQADAAYTFSVLWRFFIQAGETA